MTERPQDLKEVATRKMLETTPSELLKELGKQSPGLDDYITNVIDPTRRPKPQ
jgi:hypothetical protein